MRVPRPRLRPLGRALPARPILYRDVKSGARSCSRPDPGLDRHRCKLFGPHSGSYKVDICQVAFVGVAPASSGGFTKKSITTPRIQSAHRVGHDSPLTMPLRRQAILTLLKVTLRGPSAPPGADLFAANHRHTVHRNRAGIGERHQLVVNLIMANAFCVHFRHPQNPCSSTRIGQRACAPAAAFFGSVKLSNRAPPSGPAFALAAKLIPLGA